MRDRWGPLLPLGLCLLLCLGVSLYCLKAAPLLYHADAIHYLSLGKSLAQGLGYRSDQLVFPDLMQPPLYPALIALLTRLLGEPLRAAIAVCLLCQILTVLGLWCCHGLLWGSRDRWVSALLGAVSPNLAFGAALLLEPLFVCLLAWSLYLGLLALRRRSLPTALGAGLGLGLGLLSRPEVVLTGAVLFALCLLWPAPGQRLRLGGALLLGGLLCAVPYGLWMRAHLGTFELLPKVRYNVPLADINAHMAWEPDEERLGTREQRTFFTLMPDRRDFVMNHAFRHPGFDARAHFPRRPARGGRGEAKEVLWSMREVAKDLLWSTAALHPLALLLLLLGVWRGAAGEGALPPKELRLAAGAVLAMVPLNLLPALASGIDYFPRYLAATTLCAVPLVAGGAALLGRWSGRGWPAVAALAVATALLHLLGTVRAARAAVRPDLPARMAILEELCAEALPEGARLLGEHPRYAFLRGARHYQLPYSRSAEELLGYIEAHRLEYALLDAATLRRNPSRLNRALADERLWPAGWRAVAARHLPDGPAWLVKLR